MIKSKINSTSLSFLPILVFIPLTYQLIINLHFGGFELFQEFVISIFNPKINNEIIINVFRRLKETMIISYSSWIISIFFGIIFGIISSNIFYNIFNVPIFFKRIIRLFLTIIRSIHEIIWGLILMQIYGLNFSVAIIAICIPYTAINSKVFAEQLDNIDRKSLASIKNINGPNFSTLITLIWNPIINTFKNFGIYRLECSIRSSVILGFFGIGGIGTSILLSFQTLNFRELWTYLWSLAILILISRRMFKKVKLGNTNPNLNIFLITIIIVAIFTCLFYFIFFIFNENIENTYAISNLFNSDLDLNTFKILKLISDTIILSLLSTGIAISLPPFLLFILNNKIGFIFIRLTAFFLRLLPLPLLILVLLTFNNPSLSLAALTLGLHNSGITNKLLITNLDLQDNKNYIAMKSLGASKRNSWLLGLFAKQAKSYLAYCAYRSDIIIRETAIVGLIGSVGLGWQLHESLSSFAWKEVGIVLIAYSSIAIIGESINAKIKSALT